MNSPLNPYHPGWALPVLRWHAFFLAGSGDEEEAWEWWRAAATRGDTQSAWCLGLSLLNKKLSQRHVQEALFWLQAGSPPGKEKMQTYSIATCRRILSAREIP